MRIDSFLSLGLQGVQNGLRQADAAASKIASEAVAEGRADITHPLADLRTARLQVQASARVIEAYDDMIGTLLDEHA